MLYTYYCTMIFNDSQIICRYRQAAAAATTKPSYGQGGHSCETACPTADSLSSKLNGVNQKRAGKAWSFLAVLSVKNHKFV